MLSRSLNIAFLFATWGVFFCGVAQAQIAPGPVSRAHADLDGVTKCTSCHDFGARRLKCLECHAEIRQRVEAGKGYHSRAYKNSPGETDCARCHAEHKGPKFKLITLERKSFDHGGQTGFILEGKHRAQKCENCHAATKIAVAVRSEIKMKDLNQSFLGLRRECVSCHQDPHQSQLGTDCLGCHLLDAWKPASKFNHSRASFQLTGQHQQVQCAKCHKGTGAARGSDTQAENAPAEGKKVLLFKGLSFSGCQSCHTDQHHGAFQAVKVSGKCDGCHNTGGWKRNRPGNDFNHNVTKFSLAGKHAEVTCGKCHKESDFARQIAHELCRNCHEDPHKGQFASRAAGSDCSACHSPKNFKPTLFDRAAHMRSTYPLEGKHSTLPCAKCHQPEGRDARYKTGKMLCAECHAEPHGREFASAPYNNKCDLCHTTAGFAATTFSLERHAQTQFPLTGRHTDVGCHKCHKPLPPAVSNTAAETSKASLEASPLVPADKAPPDTRRRYHFASRGCNTCHNDPHGINPQANLACETCHVTQQFKATLPFDHSRTKFKLEGSHQDPARPITCGNCHKPSGPTDGAASGTAPQFSRRSAQCSGCHAEKDPHGGQFSSPANRQRDCSSCHTAAAWKAGGFDHDTARFALNKVHRNVTCTKCHKEQKEANGKMYRVYRDTPVDCLKCHN